MKEQIRPITPSEAEEARLTRIPECVISAVNQLLKEKYDGHEARITQNELLNIITDEETPREYFFRNKCLDFEDLYREQGWDVVYDKPGFNECYVAYWIFKPLKR